MDPMLPVHLETLGDPLSDPSLLSSYSPERSRATGVSSATIYATDYNLPDLPLMSLKTSRESSTTSFSDNHHGIAERHTMQMEDEEKDEGTPSPDRRTLPAGEQSKAIGGKSFLHKLYDFVNESRMWSEDGLSFNITNPIDFSRRLSENKTFKESNFQNFVRQLNMYGFTAIKRASRAQRRTVELQVFRFQFRHNKGLFQRGKPELVNSITRKSTDPLSQHGAGVRQGTAITSFNGEAEPIESNVFATWEHHGLDAKVAEALSAVERLRIDSTKLEQHPGYTQISGGFGTIRVARFGDQLVAVKQLHIPGAHVDRARFTMRFARELKVWAPLDHPNLLKLYGFHLCPQLLTAEFVSPFYPHGHIGNYLDRHTPDQRERQKLARDTALGLQYLHDLKIVHGDLKEANVLVDFHVRAILCDYGLARMIDECDGPSGLTTSKNPMSTRFASPELLDDSPRGLPSDIWAWACLFLKIMTDINPYAEAPKEAACIRRIVMGHSPADVSSLNIDESLKEMLSMCWKFDPSLRPSIVECINIMQIFGDLPTWIEQLNGSPLGTTITLQDQEHVTQIRVQAEDMEYTYRHTSSPPFDGVHSAFPMQTVPAAPYHSTIPLPQDASDSHFRRQPSIYDSGHSSRNNAGAKGGNATNNLDSSQHRLSGDSSEVFAYAASHQAPSNSVTQGPFPSVALNTSIVPGARRGASTYQSPYGLIPQETFDTHHQAVSNARAPHNHATDYWLISPPPPTLILPGGLYHGKSAYDLEDVQKKYALPSVNVLGASASGPTRNTRTRRHVPLYSRRSSPIPAKHSTLRHQSSSAIQLPSLRLPEMRATSPPVPAQPMDYESDHSAALVPMAGPLPQTNFGLVDTDNLSDYPYSGANLSPTGPPSPQHHLSSQSQLSSLLSPRIRAISPPVHGRPMVGGRSYATATVPMAEPPPQTGSRSYGSPISYFEWP